MSKKYYLAIALVLVVGLALVSWFSMEEPLQAVENYGSLPRLVGKSYDGQKVDTQALRGKVLIVDLWATWCPPCRKEIPHFIALQKAYGPKGLQIIGLSMDDEEAQHTQFAKSQGLNYPSIFLPNGHQKLLDDLMKVIGPVEGIPTTLIVDRQGKIVTKHVGYADQAFFEAQIKKLL